MADRIIEMRRLLRSHLEALGSPLDWSHITDQVGGCSCSTTALLGSGGCSRTDPAAPHSARILSAWTQIGMFTYTGMTPEQVDKLTHEHSIYLTRNGRISMAGINTCAGVECRSPPGPKRDVTHPSRGGCGPRWSVMLTNPPPSPPPHTPHTHTTPPPHGYAVAMWSVWRQRCTL